MKAILIDPYAREVSEVETTGKLDDLYRLLDCRTIESVQVYAEVFAIVDEEGLYRADVALWRMPWMSQPIVGKGLLVSVDDEGELIPPKITLPTVRHNVQWPEAGHAPATQLIDLDTGESTTIGSPIEITRNVD